MVDVCVVDVVDIRCGGCLVWWMSYFTHGVVDVLWWMSSMVDVLFYMQCGGCLVWWMSGVVDVGCGECLVWWMSFFTYGLVDV